MNDELNKCLFFSIYSECVEAKDKVTKIPNVVLSDFISSDSNNKYTKNFQRTVRVFGQISYLIFP